MDLPNHDRALTDCGRNTLRRAPANVADSEDAGHACLEAAGSALSRQDIAGRLALDRLGQPCGAWFGPGQDEQRRRRDLADLARLVVADLEPLEPRIPAPAHHLVAQPHLDV